MSKRPAAALAKPDYKRLYFQAEKKRKEEEKKRMEEEKKWKEEEKEWKEEEKKRKIEEKKWKEEEKKRKEEEKKWKEEEKEWKEEEKEWKEEGKKRKEAEEKLAGRSVRDILGQFPPVTKSILQPYWGQTNIPKKIKPPKQSTRKNKNWVVLTGADVEHWNDADLTAFLSRAEKVRVAGCNYSTGF